MAERTLGTRILQGVLLSAFAITAEGCGSGAPAVPGSADYYATATARVRMGLIPNNIVTPSGPVVFETPANPPVESFAGPLSSGEAQSGNTLSQSGSEPISTPTPVSPLTPGIPQFVNGRLYEPESGVSFPPSQDPKDPTDADGQADECYTIDKAFVKADPKKDIIAQPYDVFRIVKAWGGGVYSEAPRVLIVYSANSQPVTIYPHEEMIPDTDIVKPFHVAVCDPNSHQ